MQMGQQVDKDPWRGLATPALARSPLGGATSKQRPVLACIEGLSVSMEWGQWFGYVARKCSAVVAKKGASFARVAQLGCQISEIGGVTGECVACRERRLAARYCVIQE